MTPLRSHGSAAGRCLHLLIIGVLCVLSTAATDTKEEVPLPCTVKSPSTHAFFDLNKIVRLLPTEKDFERHKDDPDWDVKSYHVKGHDYGANFTMNFCAPVVENVIDVEGIEENMWRNVSAFYQKNGKTYSLGMENSEPILRGRILVLNYTNGSPCPDPPLRSELASRQRSKASLMRHEAEELESAKRRMAVRNMWDEDEDDRLTTPERPAGPTTLAANVRRKSMILSLMCEKDPIAPRATISFVGSPDECSYFFEVRTFAACAGVDAPHQSLSPGGVFGVMALIAVLVYMIGGCMYQRTVMHHRGWRQLPNYSMWSSCWSGFTDFFIILTSSCTRLVPRRKTAYARVSGSPNGYGRARQSHTDDENRLIDQLDEEWDD